jgi:hypothetical protein
MLGSKTGTALHVQIALQILVLFLKVTGLSELYAGKQIRTYQHTQTQTARHGAFALSIFLDRLPHPRPEKSGPNQYLHSTEVTVRGVRQSERAQTAYSRYPSSIARSIHVTARTHG